MSKRLLSDWIKAYCDYTRHSESPTTFHFWTAVSVLAGALRRRVWIDMRYFQWTPNFYIFLVAPPGIVSKSTTASIGMSLLRKIEGINFGPDAITWQALTKALVDANELVEYPDGSFISMSCLTISAGELGTFFNPQDREMVDVLVSLWDSQLGNWAKSTKTQGNDVIENPWLNIIGCTTPAWIKGNVPEYMIGGGFTSRSIFIYADKKRQFKAYPGLEEEDATFEKEKADLIYDLGIIAQIHGEYKLAPEAIEWGKAWYEEHWTKERPIHLASDRLAGYLARKQTHIHKLAMVIAAAQRDSLIIQMDDLSIAEKLIRSVEKDMIKVFESIGGAAESAYATELIALVRVYKTISKMDLWRLMHHQLGTPSVYDETLRSALMSGYISISSNGTITANAST